MNPGFPLSLVQSVTIRSLVLYALFGDCNDNNPIINPAQTEVPYNGLDDDCNANTLEDDPDQDGFLIADDCDDNNSAINPNQEELPYNSMMKIVTRQP